MGAFSDDLYTEVDGVIISVHARVNINPLSIKGGETIYEMKINGEIKDTFKHASFPKSGVLLTHIEVDNKKKSICIEIKPGILKTKYRLLVDDRESHLVRASETDIKYLWHKNAMKQ